MRAPILLPLPVLVPVLVLPLTAQTVIYVDRDAGGANTGSSWGDAFPRLQDALAVAVAVAPAEIWVAEGTYRPNEDFMLPPDAREDSFVVPDGVSVYGGFDGLEALREERDPQVHPTILSGDLLGDDADLGGGVWTGTSENSHHVLSAPAGTTLVDGVTITAGNSDTGGGGIVAGGAAQFVDCLIERNASAADGGGASVSGTSTFTGCRFLHNDAVLDGGGVHVPSGTATFTDCRFEGNDADAEGGGLATAGATLNLSGCEFDSNTSDGDGGGAIYFDTTSGEFTATDCVFQSNVGRVFGGAMYSALSSGGTLMTFTDCRFIGNSTTSSFSNGGALYLRGIYNRSVGIQSCEFTGNSCVSSGGAIMLLEGSTVDLLIEGCAFRGNQATGASGAGGAVRLELLSGPDANTEIRDCAFQGNRSGGAGGACFLGTSTSNRTAAEAFNNCSFQGNAAVGFGGAFSAEADSSIFAALNLHNCVVWNNSSAGVTTSGFASMGGGFITLSGDHNLVQNFNATGAGSLDGKSAGNDPLFVSAVDPLTAPHPTGDLRLGVGSPVLDIGDNTANTSPTDIAGAPRISNTTIDFGAHEAIPGAEVVVRQVGGGELADGGTIDLGVLRLEDGTVVAEFEVENAGLGTLDSLSVGASGPASGSTALVQPTASLAAYETTTFGATVTLSASGPLSLTLSLASNDADENPFDITLSGTVASDLVDTDMDGLSDYYELTDNQPGTDPNDADTDGDGVKDGAEINLAGLGFANGRDDSARLAEIRAAAPALGLYTGSALQSLAVGSPVLSRDPISGNFTLKTGMLVSPDLATPFAPLTGFSPTYFPGTGEILLEFPPPYPDAAFIQVFAEQQ